MNYVTIFGVFFIGLMWACILLHVCAVGMLIHDIIKRRRENRRKSNTTKTYRYE